MTTDYEMSRLKAFNIAVSYTDEKQLDISASRTLPFI